MTDANPNWPDSGQPWALEFANRAADAIFTAIHGAAKGVAEEVQDSVREALRSIADGVGKMAIRDVKSELLWIRTSLDSPSAGRSYRGLDGTDLLVHVVMDISHVTTGEAPPSVGFFVRELVAALSKKKVRLAETLVEAGPKLSHIPEAQRLSKNSLATIGRRGLLDCAVRPNSEEQFESQTGFKDSYEETLPELAVRLYRELQIVKLLTSS